MRVINLKAENFKRLRAVEITPNGDVVTIGGKNGMGKSSVLDAIYVALRGRAAAPPQPVRKGEEKCTILLDLGELVVTRTFTAKEGGETYTDTLKVENAEGLRYGKPQNILDALLGEIGFDPFGFVQMKPDAQAETLLNMVPLSVNLDELAELDTSDFAKRRDFNRDAKALQAQVDAIPKHEVPAEAPDRDALIAALGNAANVNTAINTDRLRRENEERQAVNMTELAEQARFRAKDNRAAAAKLLEEAEQEDSDAIERDIRATNIRNDLAALPPVDEYVDTDALRLKIHEAEAVAEQIGRQARRAALVEQVNEALAQSKALTDAMMAREAQRATALAAAKMPIDGLSFHVPETGKARVYFNGVPFEQASTAEQLKASTAIAIAANPTLRVLRIKDGSLLDEDSMKILADLAATEDLQLWVEIVGEGGAGIIMEDGSVRATEPEATKESTPAKAAAADAPKPSKAKAKGPATGETLL